MILLFYFLFLKRKAPFLVKGVVRRGQPGLLSRQAEPEATKPGTPLSVLRRDFWSVFDGGGAERYEISSD